MPSMHGAYAHPQTFWDTGATLDEYGINSVFIHGASIDHATFDHAKNEGCSVYAEFATLNGRYGDWIEKNPDAHPIDDTGNPAAAATCLWACAQPTWDSVNTGWTPCRPCLRTWHWTEFGWTTSTGTPSSRPPTPSSSKPASVTAVSPPFRRGPTLKLREQTYRRSRSGSS